MTVAGSHGSGNHAGRPAANTVPDGSLYSCSTHSLIYVSNYAGNSWSTWASLSGTGLADPMTTRGDIIVRGAGGTTRLALGSLDQALVSDGTDAVWGNPNAKGRGCRASRSTTLAINSGAWTEIPLTAANTWDTDSYHPSTSVANLTGTVAKTASNVTIVGTGTSFTTELAVGQMVDIPGGAGTDRVIVASIADNTHFDCVIAPAATAAGQTGTRVASGLTIWKASLAGVYDVTARVNHAATATGMRYCGIQTISSPTRPVSPTGSNLVPANATTNPTVLFSDTVKLALGDYVVLFAYQDNGSAQNIQSGNLSMSFSGKA